MPQTQEFQKYSHLIFFQLLHILIKQINKKAAHLYRKSLKTLASWAIDREIFIDEAEKLRARFDAERGCSAAKAVRLLKVRILIFYD